MKSISNYVCDLHGHTNRSDGNDSPLEFLLHAKERGMRIVAITDHDKRPPESVNVDGREEEIVSYAESLGLKLIKGIEISCETEIEDCHLVCFGCDWESDLFQELDDFTIKSKVNSYRALVEMLDEIGMPMSWQEILDRWDISEKDVQKKMIFNMMAEKGYTESWSKAKLMVKRDKRLSISREKPDAVEIIHKIHRMGGIVILAHPYLMGESVDFRGRQISRNEFIDTLIFEGLDGIEARYTYDKTAYNGRLTKEEIYAEVIELYRSRLSIISGGSDYHADYMNGVRNPRDIGECGLTESEFYSNRILRKLIEQ